ncbi:ATP-binding cassette domain-containing protein [Amycolatopsis sp. YIM 10]|uniref:ATP-binding cassette domain-containing protein n=1 Tax=Amycolatopsis sp. YIM 10 TaxID=2653857 RepID=UPI00128FFD6E|nr:ATP-binding cassette domain-containing protein [Amycolatopsis sp. YIM 10]QFU87049.1 Daunorubicin/doxorubicin resistance ATP-binding protein DrrA [Amycolatopsis sp. YIM 10]
MSTHAIEASGLVKTYGKGARAVHALAGLGFTVPAGIVFGLLGPNGAGKSTTVKILTTLSAPDAGQATVAGIDVRRHPGRVRRVIGSVSQKPAFDPVSTGRENLVLQGHLHGLSAASARGRAKELLDRFGLTDAADRPAGKWSGGMQRKLDVALGLVARPSVLFLDEPTTGLDPEARAEMWAEIARLSGEDGLTVLLTTHYLEEADKLAARLVIVDRGQVVATGSPEELKTELNGDSVHAELSTVEDLGAARRALEPVAGEISVEGLTLRARVSAGATALPGVLAALGRAGVEPVSIGTARPSLDDVYLRHAGRDFRTADTVAGGVR